MDVWYLFVKFLDCCCGYGELIPRAPHDDMFKTPADNSEFMMHMKRKHERKPL